MKIVCSIRESKFKYTKLRSIFYRVYKSRSFRPKAVGIQGPLLKFFMLLIVKIFFYTFGIIYSFTRIYFLQDHLVSIWAMYMGHTTPGPGARVFLFM